MPPECCGQGVTLRPHPRLTLQLMPIAGRENLATLCASGQCCGRISDHVVHLVFVQPLHQEVASERLQGRAAGQGLTGVALVLRSCDYS